MEQNFRKEVIKRISNSQLTKTKLMQRTGASRCRNFTVFNRYGRRYNRLKKIERPTSAVKNLCNREFY